MSRSVQNQVMYLHFTLSRSQNLYSGPSRSAICPPPSPHSVCAATLASNTPVTLLSGAFAPAVDLSWMLLPQLLVWLTPHLLQVCLRRHLLGETYPDNTKNFETHTLWQSRLPYIFRFSFSPKNLPAFIILYKYIFCFLFTVCFLPPEQELHKGRAFCPFCSHD